jgi:hypothetical protein
MKKYFVTYEIALKLKKLGFDEPCLAVFNGEKIVYSDTKNNNSLNHEDYKNIFGELCLAPLWQQATDWLLEKHDIQVVVSSHTIKNGNYGDFIAYVNNIAMNDPRDEEYQTKIEALEFGINHALKIIKNINYQN